VIMIRAIESHIIQKQSIEISFEEMDAGVGVQHRVAELFHERLQPAMDKLFDEMVGSERSAVIEHLEIDCGVLSSKGWEEEWLEQVIRQLRAQLREVNKSPVDKQRKAADSFFFFLTNGMLPWNGLYSSTGELEDLIVTDSFFIARLKELVQTNRGLGKRLLLQFSRKFKQRLIGGMQEVDEDHLLEEKVDSKLPGDYDKLLLELIDKQNVRKEVNRANDPVQEKPEQDPVTTIYINNAGLILLHPFLSALFGRLNLTKEDKWVDESSAQTAMLILQWLVNGESDFPEYELPLNKILCNWPMTEPVDREIEIDANTQRECDELLEEVIRHWSRLKNTGIDAFRETFLRQIGKLSRVNNGWLLQVEQKSLDVLLGGLPWSINVVKLPWMKEILYVEWL